MRPLDCGCRYTKANGIRFCSLHNAAPRLLDAIYNLEAYDRRLRQGYDEEKSLPVQFFIDHAKVASEAREAWIVASTDDGDIDVYPAHDILSLKAAQDERR